MNNLDELAKEAAERLRSQSDEALDYMIHKIVWQMMQEVHRRGRSLTLHSSDYVDGMPDLPRPW